MYYFGEQTVSNYLSTLYAELGASNRHAVTA